MKILLSGGGTMGSVSPLIAVYQEVKKGHPDTQFLFVGSKIGPEQKAVESYSIEFKTISSGRLRRYFSWQNLIDPFKVIVGFFQAFGILLKFRPNVVMVTGSFVGVPVAKAAGFLGIPVLVHQLDIVPSLANKLVSGTAKKITVSFEPSLKDFYPNKTVLTGNPVREEFLTCEAGKSSEFFGLKKNVPVLLVVTGGTGALVINQLIEKSLAELLQFCQVIHLTGKGKQVDVQADGYYQFEFLTNEMQEALCVADVVVSRAGMATLSELAVLAKPTILIPIPNENQEGNANYFRKNNAVVVLSQNGLSKEVFVETVKNLIVNKAEGDNLSRNISKTMDSVGAQKVAQALIEIAK